MPPAARLREEGHRMSSAPSARAAPPHTAPCSPDTWGTRHPSPLLPGLSWVCQRRPSGENQGLLRGPLEPQAACSRGGGTLHSAELCYCREEARVSAWRCRTGHAPCQAGADLSCPGSSGDGVASCAAAPSCAGGLRMGTRDDVTGAVLMSHPDVVAQASPSEGPLESRGGALGPRDPPRAEARNGSSSHERHPSPSSKAGGASSTQTQATSSCSEGSEGGGAGAGAEVERNQKQGPPLQPLWHLLLSVAFGEAAVLLLFLLLFCSALAHPEAAWVVPPGLARLFRLVSLLGIALELLHVGDSLRSHFQLRPGASSGLHLGAMALPASLLARAVLHSAWTGAPEQGSVAPPSCAHIRVSEHMPCAPSVLDLHCWGALSCAASALAGVLALRLTRQELTPRGDSGTSSPRLQSNERETNGGAAGFRTSEAAAAGGHNPESDTQGINGHVHPTTSYVSSERQAKTGSEGLINGSSDLGPFFLGWGAASACVAAAAAASWGVPAAWPGLASAPALGPLAWLLCLSLLSSLVFGGSLALFPRSFTAGEAMLASQGLTLYAGDALGMTLARLAPAVPLPPFGAPFSATGDQIHAIIQAMVLGLLLLPATGTALTRLVSSALAHAPSRRTRANSSDCGNSRKISDSSKGQGQGEGDGIGGGAMGAAKGSASVGAASAGAEREGVVSKGVVSTAVGFGLGTVLVVCVGAPLWLLWVGGMTQHPVLWALLQVLEDPQPRASLCFYWLATALLPLPLLQRAAAAGAVPRIVLRKAYHLMAVAMFVPALLLQPGFLRLAFGVALCAFLFLEVLRVCQVAPLGPVLDRFMCAFADSRDAGPIIVSHFSLLLGCALPLWLAPYPSAAHPAASAARGPAYLAPFAGILSIGIGDTMASVVGKRYGRHRIARDSPKTVEGTLACVAFTFLACAGLVPALCAIHGCAFGARDWGQVLLATAVSGLLEAYTEQLDNAFVPLLYFASLAVL